MAHQQHSHRSAIQDFCSSPILIVTLTKGAPARATGQSHPTNTTGDTHTSALLTRANRGDLMPESGAGRQVPSATPSVDPAGSVMVQVVDVPDLIGSSTKVPTNLRELAALMDYPELAVPQLPLGKAVSAFEAHVRSSEKVPSWSFYRDLLPLICTWASEEPWASKPLPLLRQGEAKKVTLTRAWCRCLMSNAFLLNIRCPKVSDLDPTTAPQEGHAAAAAAAAGPGGNRQEETFPQHSWYRVFKEQYSGDVSETKVKCLLAYFLHASKEAYASAPDSDIVVERVQADSGAVCDFSTWSSSTAPIRTSAVNVHTDTMETPPAHAFVNFANRFVGYKAIIPSMTQEEVLWCMVPEAQVSSLMCEVMRDTEAVVVRNVTRVSQYTGYLDTCRWTGFWTPSTLDTHPATLDLLTMDALVVRGSEQQFAPEAMSRDLVKAWLCFGACGAGCSCAAAGEGAGDSAAPIPGGSGGAGGSGGSGDASGTGSVSTYRISTGNWGCGVFGGNKVLKFLQQVCAAAEVNTTRTAPSQPHQPASQPPQQPASQPPQQQLQLDFSTFGDTKQLAELQSLMVALERAGATVGLVCRLAAEYGGVVSKVEGGASKGGGGGRGRGAKAADASRREQAFLEWLMVRLAAGPAPATQGSCVLG